MNKPMAMVLPKKVSEIRLDKFSTNKLQKTFNRQLGKFKKNQAQKIDSKKRKNNNAGGR